MENNDQENKHGNSETCRKRKPMDTDSNKAKTSRKKTMIYSETTPASSSEQPRTPLSNITGAILNTSRQTDENKTNSPKHTQPNSNHVPSKRPRTLCIQKQAGVNLISRLEAGPSTSYAPSTSNQRPAKVRQILIQPETQIDEEFNPNQQHGGLLNSICSKSCVVH